MNLKKNIARVMAVSMVAGTMLANAASAATTYSWDGDPATATWQGNQPATVTATFDHITINAEVDPSISFDVTATLAACNYEGSFSAGSYLNPNTTLDLGHLNASTLYRSASGFANAGVGTEKMHICTLLSTNATSGAHVYVKNLHGSSGLVSGTDSIPSVATIVGQANNMTAGHPNYGIFALTGASGSDETNVSPTADTPSLGEEETATAGDFPANITALSDVTPYDIWSVDDVTSNAYQTLGVAAIVSPTQAAHQDYSDQLTFIATATF